eukprot:403353077
MSEDCQCGYFDYLAIILGIYVLLPKLFGIYDCIYKSFFLKQHDLLARYADGNNSWVLVTGCTSGIGEEIAKRFASLGFNIILVSRSMDRLNRVKSEIQHITNNSVQTKIVVADFAKGGETIQMYEDIYQQIKDLDIAILVNNAGVNTRSYFKDTSIEDIMDMVVVNTYPYTLLTRHLLHKLNERKTKSAIINICSSIVVNPCAFDAMYASTKVYELFQMESLRREQAKVKDNKVDFLTLNPAYVSTNNARLHPGGNVETTETFINCAFKALGNISVTYGTPKHCRNGYVLEVLSGLMHQFNAYHFVSEKIVGKLAAQMWEKRK